MKGPFTHVVDRYKVFCQTFLRYSTAPRGIAFTVLLFGEAGEERQRKEERMKCDSDTPLSVHCAPSLPLLCSPAALCKGMFNT